MTARVMSLLAAMMPGTAAAMLVACFSRLSRQEGQHGSNNERPGGTQQRTIHDVSPSLQGRSPHRWATGQVGVPLRWIVVSVLEV